MTKHLQGTKWGTGKMMSFFVTDDLLISVVGLTNMKSNNKMNVKKEISGKAAKKKTESQSQNSKKLAEAAENIKKQNSEKAAKKKFEAPGWE